MCAVLLVLALRGIMSGRGVFEFPAVAAMLALAWIVPQGIELEQNPYNLYRSEMFWAYVTACFLFIVLGFRYGRRAGARRIWRTPRRALVSYDARKLTLAAGGLVAFGSVNLMLIGGVDTSDMGGGWTGIITMYALFAGAVPLGFCMAVLLFVRIRSWTALATAVIAAVPLLMTAMSGVRREVLFDLVVLTAGSYYLAKRSFPPRFAVIACLLVGTVVLNKAGDLRLHVKSQQGTLVEALLSKDFYKNFDYFNLGQGEASEVGLAQHDFWYVNNNGMFEYGASYYNAIVKQYVPSFLLGRDLKDSLMIDTLDQRASQGGDIAFSTGSTRTGFSDSYRSFWWFGALVFGSIGYAFGRLYAWGAAGGIAEQYFYLVLMAHGLKAITHSTAELFATLPFTVSISLVVLWLAQTGPVSASARRGPSPHHDGYGAS
jgi:hypothetical protein